VWASVISHQGTWFVVLLTSPAWVEIRQALGWPEGRRARREPVAAIVRTVFAQPD